MQALLRKIRQILKDRRTRRFFTRAVSSVAAIVVFITTYALILPAITLERTAACGIEEHQHNDSCYEDRLVCGQEESDGHHHDDSCYSISSELICRIQEHQHSAENGCYDADGNLVCQLQEHVHDDSCYKEVRTLTCGLEESKGHQHTDACYKKVLICGKEVHTHSAACYQDTGENSDQESESGNAANPAASENPGADSAAAENNTSELTDSDNAATAETVLPGQEVTTPELAPLDFTTILNKDTGVYYYSVKPEEKIEDSSKITDWTRAKDKNDNADDFTELASEDLIRVYLAYTVPAGSLNTTNPTARYRLPDSIRLSDKQIEAINKAENGISSQYDDKDKHDAALGAEAIEGTRRPDQDIDEYLRKNSEDGQEYINATVKAENVFNDKTGEYEGQDLIFTFTPYTIEKNQVVYDTSGEMTKSGENVRGWFTFDMTTDQVEWGEAVVSSIKTGEETEGESEEAEDIETENVEVDNTAEQEKTSAEETTTSGNKGSSSVIERSERSADIVLVKEGYDVDNNRIEEIATTLKLVEEKEVENSLEDDSDSSNDDTASDFAAGTLEASGEGYKITMEYTAEAQVPENASLSVREITAETDPEAYKECLEQAGKKMASEDSDDANDKHAAIDETASRFFDIEIVVPEIDENGQETSRKIEPKAEVSVNIQMTDTVKKASDNSAQNTNENDKASGSENQGAQEPTVLHFTDDGVEKLQSTVVDDKNSTSGDQAEDREKKDSETAEDTDSAGSKNGSTEIQFTTDSFSIYGVVYTVDFHWEINGKMYDFSIPGGGFVSLEHVVEVLGIASSDENSENGAENAENGAENGNDFVGEVPGVDVSVGNDTAYEEAIKLNELEVSEATKKFVADVESVEFSSPELVWVGKVDDEVTVGGLKEANRLEVEYSAELTEEQIAEINGQSVEAGDWALISVQPFMSEETLTVTMKNGEVFTIHVTDDNDPLGLNGRTYALLAFNGVHALIRNNNAITSLGINKSVGTDYAFSGGKEYIRQDATAWEFKYNSEKQAYQISNNGQYLSINPNATSGAPVLVTDATAASTWIKITRDESGNYYLGNEMAAFIYDNNGTFALTTNSSDNRTAFHMCLPENPDGSHKATLTAAKDLSVGQTIVIYQKVWNSQTDEYDYYAIDGNGKLQKVWDSSDSLYWKENISIEWELREETDSDGIPTGYLQLYNEKTGTYLAPKSSGTGFAATHAASSITAEDMKAVRVSLPGRDAGEYSSRIATWDYDDNTTYGLDVNYDPTNTAEPYTLVVKELLQSSDFLFAVRDPLVQKQLTTVDTVDSISKGIKISMFDFEGKVTSSRLNYMNYIIGHREYAPTYYTPGIMSRTLGDDGFPVSVADGSWGNQSLKNVYYPPNSVRNDGTNNYYIARQVDDANHLFLQSVYDSTGYFYYSGFDNFATLPEGSSDFRVYEQVGSPNASTNSAQQFYWRGNFLPFNDLDPTKEHSKTNITEGSSLGELPDEFPRKGEDLYLIKGSADYFFGMILETKFQQGPNGLSDNGDPVVFEFNGDDDLWVYADGVLLLDIGGVHDAFHGKINFQTGKIHVDGQSTGDEDTWIKDQYWQAHKFPDGTPWTDRNDPKQHQFFTNGGEENGKLKGTYLDYSTHDLKMFYMERGRGASNLQLQFNLPVITRDEFRVTKNMLTTATGQPIQSAYADAAFYYKAYIKQGDNWVEYKKSDYPAGTTAVYDDEKRTSVVWKEIIDPNTGEVTGYSDTIFEVKPGQTAVIPVADSQVEYKVVEVEPEPGISHMLDNFNVSNSDQDPDDSKSTVGKTVKRRGQVFFDNKPVDEIVNELRITKNLHGIDNMI